MFVKQTGSGDGGGGGDDELADVDDNNSVGWKFSRGWACAREDAGVGLWTKEKRAESQS